MHVKLILPKTYVDRGALAGLPLFYLAGPIRGADDWQAKAIQMLDEHYRGNCAVVNPSRYDETHPLYGHKAYGDEKTFSHQTNWENYYMTEAAGHGCLIFWLPCESRENPRPRADGPYAQDTYGELGYWRAMLEISERGGTLRPMVSIGAEFAFPGLKKLWRDLDRAVAGSFSVQSSLQDTVKEAVRLARLSL